MSNQDVLEFSSKSCKNNSHNICIGHWEGLGFKVQCNCECHKKSVLGRIESRPNTGNSPNKSDGEYEYY
jgi:hypothetical protein